jgi:hypothetical protein
MSELIYPIILIAAFLLVALTLRLLERRRH